MRKVPIEEFAKLMKINKKVKYVKSDMENPVFVSYVPDYISVKLAPVPSVRMWGDGVNIKLEGVSGVLQDKAGEYKIIGRNILTDEDYDLGKISFIS